MSITDLLVWVAPLFGMLLLALVLGLIAGWFLDRDKFMMWVIGGFTVIGVALLFSPHWTW